MRQLIRGLSVLTAWIGTTVVFVVAAERSELFDRDPHWDGRNNRAAEPAPQQVTNDFGYSRTAHAGGAVGEIGGLITPAAEAAYYAAPIPEASFERPLSASGAFACGNRPFHVLLGFFNSDSVNEWRTPNSIALRLNGRGEHFLAYVEYCTAKWRAGGDSPRSFPTVRNETTGRNDLVGFAAGGAVHRWSLSYDPQGNGGLGVVTATMDGETAVCNLDQGHKADGAKFNRFGLLTVMKSYDTPGELWVDDVTIDGRRDDFANDPKWDARNNRRTYLTPIVRPRFDFGFSQTQFAGGMKPGELGGTVFRGDCRYPEKMAHYGDRLEPLTLERPLRAKGKVALRRGVSDSGVLIGFYDSRASTESNPAQNNGLPKHFLGVSTDAPSRDGFYFSPTYRADDNSYNASLSGAPPRLYPDGATHDWTLEYSPTGGAGFGQIVVTLDDQRAALPVAAADRAAGPRFDRFGIISTWIDGNSQSIYFDDLTYTFRQE